MYSYNPIKKIVDDFISDAEQIVNLPAILKDYLMNCSVESFYELETEKLLIRFNNTKDLIKENLEGYFLKNGFFAFADNSDCDIFLLDVSVTSDFGVYIGSTDLFDNEQEIVFYKNGIVTMPFNYENIKRMSIKVASDFNSFIFDIIDEKDLKYDVVSFVIDKYKPLEKQT